MCMYDDYLVAVEVSDIVGAEWIERRDMGDIFIGPLTTKGNDGGSRDFGSREGRIGCLKCE